MDRKSFLDQLCLFNKDEINKYIEENGQPLKPVNPMIIIKTDDKDERRDSNV